MIIATIFITLFVTGSILAFVLIDWEVHLEMTNDAIGDRKFGKYYELKRKIEMLDWMAATKHENSLHYDDENDIHASMFRLGGTTYYMMPITYFLISMKVNRMYKKSKKQSWDEVWDVLWARKQEIG